MNPRTLKIALAASVALNLFAVAGGGAAWWMWSRVEAKVADQQRPPRTQTMKEIVGAMEPQVSERVLRSLRASAMAARPDFEASRTARREAIEAASAPTLDAAAVIVLLDRARESEMRGRERLEHEAVALFETLDVKDRQALAVIFKRHGRSDKPNVRDPNGHDPNGPRPATVRPDNDRGQGGAYHAGSPSDPAPVPPAKP